MKRDLTPQSYSNSTMGNSIRNQVEALWPRFGGPLLVLVIAVLVEMFDYFGYKIPNPPSLLLLVVVYITFIGGYLPGFVSAVLAWFYIAVFFSLPDQPFHYTEENQVRVIVWGITTPLMVWMVGILEHRSSFLKELKQLNKELHESKASYQLLVNSASDGILVSDAQCKLQEVNAVACRMFGYTREELLKMRIREIVADTEVLRIDPEIERLHTDKVVMSQWLCRRKNETLFTGEVSATVLPDGQLLGILRDITGRTRSKEDRYDLARVIEASINEIYLINPESLRFEFVNSGARKNLGYSLEQLYTMTPMDIKPEFTEESFRKMLGPLLSGEQAMHVFNTVHRRADGSLYPVEVHLQLVEQTGQSVFLAVIIDITERIQTEQALKRNEEQLRFLYEENPSMYFMVAPDGTVLSVNKFGASVLGYNIAELTGKSVLELFPEYEHENAMKQLQGCLNNFGQQQEWEAEKVRKNGEKLWVKETARAVSMPDGKTAVLIVCRDITERKQAENKLRETEIKVSLILKSAGEGIYGLDVNGNTTFINPAGENMLGWKVGELIGKLQHSIIHHTKADGSPYSSEECPIYTAFKDGKVHHVDDEVFWCKDGTSFPVEYTATPIWKDGKLAGAVVVFSDITERVLMERALRESEARARTIADFSPIGIFMSTPEGQIIYENMAIRQLLGMADEEVLGDRWAEAVHPDDQDRVFTAWIRFLAGERPDYNVEFRFIRRDGTARLVHARAIPIHDSKQLIGYAGTAEDITARKQSEMNIKETNLQLRALARQLQNIREEERTGIAREIHDVLAQELTRLKLDTSRIKRQLAGNLDESTRKDLSRKVQDLSDQIDITINTVQKIATELRPAVLDKFGLSAAIEWQVEDFEQHTEIDCHVTVPVEKLPIDIEQSTTMFRILQESLTNVVRHSGATLLSVSLLQEDGELILQIQDNGCGIQPEKINNLHSIGLMGMRERALAMGGNLQITGKPASGTTVTVHIPLVGSALHAK